MVRSRKTKLERMAERIIPFELEGEGDEKFISYCSYPYHEGIIGPRRAEQCRKMKCSHHIKLIPVSGSPLKKYGK